MRKEVLLIVFIATLLFSACETVFTYSGPPGNPNTCCVLSYASGKYCMNEISDEQCTYLNNLYSSYFTGKVYYMSLANSCSDVPACTNHLACTDENNIYPSGQYICVSDGKTIYKCNGYGKGDVYTTCDSCSNDIACMNTNIVSPGIMCSDSAGVSCQPAACIPECLYSSECDNGPVPDGCDGTCTRNTNKLDCSTGDCNNPNCISSPLGNVLLYHFDNKAADGEDATHIHDYSRMENSGSCSGITCPTWITAGKLGGAYDFDGGNDYVNLGNPMSLQITGDITVLGWIYLRSVDTTNGDIVLSKWVTSTSSSYLLMISPTQKARFSIWDTSQWNAVGSTTIQVGRWYHLVGVRSGNNLYIYLNGILEGTATASSTTKDSTAAVEIGRAAASYSLVPNGLIDEVAIWNRALTDAEILELYQKDLPLCNLCTKSFCDNQQCIPQCISSPLGNVLLYHFDNKAADGEDATHIHDYSRMENNGGCSGASCPTWITAGKLGGAYNFDGGNDYVNLGNPISLQITGDITVSGWIYLRSVDTTNGDALLSKWVTSTSSSYLLMISPTQKARFSIWDTSQWNAVGSTTIQVGRWYHLVGVRSGNNLYIYLNGILEGTATASSTTKDSTAAVEIGRAAASYSLVPNGLIDEVAIWNRALTDAEILELYQKDLPLCTPPA